MASLIEGRYSGFPTKSKHFNHGAKGWHTEKYAKYALSPLFADGGGAVTELTTAQTVEIQAVACILYRFTKDGWKFYHMKTPGKFTLYGQNYDGPLAFVGLPPRGNPIGFSCFAEYFPTYRELVGWDFEYQWRNRSTAGAAS